MAARHFLRNPKDLQDYGSWAVVTGTTDGIRKALVFELASKGLNLGLIGWNPSKLEATSSELRDRFGATTEVKTGVADLTKLSGEEIAAAIVGATEGIDVRLLVNDAGLAYPYPSCFHEVDRELMESMLRVNVNAALWATKGVIDGMLKRKRGAILNSGSGSSPSPLLPSGPARLIVFSLSRFLHGEPAKTKAESSRSRGEMARLKAGAEGRGDSIISWGRRALEWGREVRAGWKRGLVRESRGHARASRRIEKARDIEKERDQEETERRKNRKEKGREN
ncbi:very-long-chain 3-oxoacyl-CoA reductase 1 [Eucalyptus grandis]|uniref:very-long-chain 3-oxoacyl-CoA reductase 1 n=1 Tax=Eucalyptus grandis TaxID=71139 RepID=UPI0005262389|nr:very-long-chain 3-oxoacyl-CoA reductase 1 [Eucalyptus grandis]